jgi:hypothetical protein
MEGLAEERVVVIGAEEAAEVEEKKATGPSEVLPWLYLGTKYHYFDSSNLKSLGTI